MKIMLLNNFYEITDTSEENSLHIFKITLNPLHRIYEGHFVGHAIVPGVCTLQMIKDCAEKIGKEQYMYGRISSAKFLSLVDPNENQLIRFNISLKEIEDNQISLVAEGLYQNTETAFIKVKATLNKIDND